MSYTHDWNQPPRPPRPPWFWDHGSSSGGNAGVPHGQMRVSDVERTEVTNALCRHFGDGRLDEAEFNERMAKATAAKTRDDLAPLLLDLPSLGASGTVPVAPQPRRHFSPVLFLILIVVVAATVIPITFAAWHVHWLLLAVIALFLLIRHDRRRRIHA